MQERIAPQYVPVKVYRSDDMLTLAAPMPGMEPEDIRVEVTGDGRLVLEGALRGALKGVKELLIDEWSVGAYHREVQLPSVVDATRGTVTYGNGVVVVALPLAAQPRGAMLSVTLTGEAHGAPGMPGVPEAHASGASAPRDAMDG
jgi:HSP20 family protein